MPLSNQALMVKALLGPQQGGTGLSVPDGADMPILKYPMEAPTQMQDNKQPALGMTDLLNMEKKMQMDVGMEQPPDSYPASPFFQQNYPGWYRGGF